MSTEEQFWSKVNRTGGCWEWTGAKSRNGYPRLGRSGYGHRISWELANGAIPPKGEIDHICHNRGCVNPAHLRLATRKQNMENHAGPKKNCKSGVRGVHLHKQSGKWRALVRHDGVIYRLGLFSDLKEAERVVVAKRNELHTFNNADRNGEAA